MGETNIDNLINGILPYDAPYMPAGFKYKEGTWNNGYTIIGDTQSTGNEFVWVPCVLNQTQIKDGDNVVTFTKTITGKYNSNNLGLLPTDTTVAAEDSSVNDIKIRRILYSKI